MLKKAKKTARTVEPGDRRVVLEAFGESDDHLRLSTLIADEVTKAVDSAGVRGVARRLTDERWPRSWRDRRSDFKEIVSLMPSDTIVLRDPDAFAEAYVTDRAGDWDDAMLCRERSEFFDTLLEPIARGAIGLERTAPDPRFSKRLASAHVSERGQWIDPQDPYASSVGPDARGALKWLLDKDHLSEAAVDELIEEGIGPELDRHFILVAYDHLSPIARKAAYRIAVLRGEQALNGALGPFPVVRSKSAAHAVTRGQVEELLSCGFLQRMPADGSVRIPRIVRDVVLARAEAEDPDEVEKDHRWVFEQLRSPSLLTQAHQLTQVHQLIECHHHAVHGLLIKEALDTAKFYATDLRELAIRLSRKNKWYEAASVYLKIVEHSDPEDAYAWEYRGYNLVRDDAEKHRGDILKAYRKAFEIDSTNPLYHGRLLGFRARVGEDIRAEFEHSISRYTWRGVDRFASEVLKGLKRGKQVRTAKQLIDAHPSLLKHPEVKHIMDVGWGHLSMD